MSIKRKVVNLDSGLQIALSFVTPKAEREIAWLWYNKDGISKYPTPEVLTTRDCKQLAKMFMEVAK